MKKIDVSTPNENKELMFLKTLKHSNILKIIDNYIEGNKIYLILEKAESDLSEYSENKLLSEDQILEIFVQILLAVEYIHSKNILHRDIKMKNVFVFKDQLVKLGDFGISEFLEGDKISEIQIGTPCYSSPEIWQGKCSHFESDIWSLGCLFYELCTKQKPFQGFVNQIYDQILNLPSPSLPSKFPVFFQSIIKMMLQKEPQNRIKIIDLLNMEQIKQARKKLFSKFPSIYLINPKMKDVLENPKQLFKSSQQKQSKKKFLQIDLSDEGIKENQVDLFQNKQGESNQKLPLLKLQINKVQKYLKNNKCSKKNYIKKKSINGVQYENNSELKSRQSQSDYFSNVQDEIPTKIQNEDKIKSSLTCSNVKQVAIHFESKPNLLFSPQSTFQTLVFNNKQQNKSRTLMTLKFLSEKLGHKKFAEIKLVYNQTKSIFNVKNIIEENQIQYLQLIEYALCDKSPSTNTSFSNQLSSENV